MLPEGFAHLWRHDFVDHGPRLALPVGRTELSDKVGHGGQPVAVVVLAAARHRETIYTGWATSELQKGE